MASEQGQSERTCDGCARVTSNWATIDEAYICAECQAEIAADEAEVSRLRAEVERLTEQLADVRVSMKVLHQQFVAAWGEPGQAKGSE